jgi:hypothetical protein
MFVVGKSATLRSVANGLQAAGDVDDADHACQFALPQFDGRDTALRLSNHDDLRGVVIRKRARIVDRGLNPIRPISHAVGEVAVR